jgi:hypothetical protein
VHIWRIHWQKIQTSFGLDNRLSNMRECIYLVIEPGEKLTSFSWDCPMYDWHRKHPDKGMRFNKAMESVTQCKWINFGI